MKNDKAKTGKESVTDYGKNSPPEDFAEAFAKYFEGKLDKFPNRKAYFDNLFKDEIASSRKKHKYFNKPVKERSGINGVSEDIYLDKQFSILGMIRGSRNNTNIEGIQIRDITSNYVTDARYESTTGDKLSLLDIVEILNNKVDVVPNMRSSFANNELMNGSVRLGISMDTIIDDIANAKLQGINIMVSNDIERLINVKNNLRSGEVLLNTYDVYRGGKAFIRQSNGDIFVGNRVLNIENTFDNFIQGKDKITTKKLADICDSLKAYELLNGNGIQVSEDSIRSMYDYMNNYFLLKDAVDAESMLNFVYAFTKYSARLNGVNVEVEFYNGEKGEFGGQARGIIALNGNFSGARNTIPYIRTLNTIFHEVYHEIQDNDTGSTRYTLGNRIDNLLKKNNALYYEDNYNMIFFEIDARYHAALMTLEYLESVAPEAYNMYKDEYMLQVVSEEANYEKNDNKYESDGITLSRDEALESIIKNNPKLLNSNEVLRFIFNDDGTRKTLFELTDVIKQNNNNQDITEMINYWVRTSSYSLESITREFFEIYKHGTVGLPNEFIQVVNNSLRHKLSETISLEIKNKVDITTKMNDILKNYQINSLKDGVVIDSFLKDMNTLVSDINNNLANTSTNSIKNMFNRNERNGAIKEELPSKTLDTAIEDISREIVRLDDRQKNRREILNNKLRVYKESKIASERLLKSYDLTSDVETKYASLEQEKLIKEEALKIYEKATRLAEAVTRDMHMLELVDGYLVGEENSIKEFDSIARKINEKALKNQGDDVLDTIRKIASEIGDGLRYTMILDIDSYVDDFSECISTLKYMGYSVKSINNAWIDDKNTTYNGINVKLDKQIGEEVITLEVQFHTEESYLTKENYTHDIYKIERGLFANEIDIKTAHDIQVSLQEIVEKMLCTLNTCASCILPSCTWV